MTLARSIAVAALAGLAGSASATWSILIVNTRTGEIAVGSATCLTGFDLEANTPVLVPVGKDRVDLVLAVQNEVWGINPDTGKLRWYAQVPISSNMAAGVVAKDGVVYAFG